MWNPWNQCWLKPQPICCSMDIMDSMWNDHGMDMEWLIPYGFHMDSTDSIWNLGISTLNSMEQVHVDSMEQVHVDSMEQFQMDSVDIPWNNTPFPWETALSKIM
jgi:hypothetical protein